MPAATGVWVTPLAGSQASVVHGLLSSTVGGGYDQYARLLAKHIVRHIPGEPTMVVQNMVGAEGIRAALHEEGGDLFKAMPVGVSLHHGHDANIRAGAVANPPEIALEGREIDFGPAPMQHRHAGS